jgi:hypothetical protein
MGFLMFLGIKTGFLRCFGGVFEGIEVSLRLKKSFFTIKRA